MEEKEAMNRKLGRMRPQETCDKSKRKEEKQEDILLFKNVPLSGKCQCNTKIWKYFPFKLYFF